MGCCVVGVFGYHGFVRVFGYHGFVRVFGYHGFVDDVCSFI